MCPVYWSDDRPVQALTTRGWRNAFVRMWMQPSVAFISTRSALGFEHHVDSFAACETAMLPKTPLVLSRQAMGYQAMPNCLTAVHCRDYLPITPIHRDANDA